MAGLSKSDKFYIEGHRDLTIAQLATDLGKTKSSHKSIQKHIDEIRKAQEEAKAKAKPPDYFGHGPQNTVVMTEGQSKLGDDIMKELSQDSGKAYLKSKEGSLFIMNPEKPVY